MARPTRIEVRPSALMHNLTRVKALAVNSHVLAMVKANAYGCGLETVVSLFEGHVDAFGVACLEEALQIRQMGALSECILFEGIFSQDELSHVVKQHLQIVIHNEQQLNWLLAEPLLAPLKVWVKINTGMNRLGFSPKHGLKTVKKLQQCAWIDKPIGLMSHFACADDPLHALNQQQMDAFSAVKTPNDMHLQRSMANSAAIMAFPQAHYDAVRPGIMLYGVSPFAGQTGIEAGLKPVMRFFAKVIAIQECLTGTSVGYGASWVAQRPSRIAVLAVGYGDGYPRHVTQGTPVYIAGQFAPIVGRVSMDMLTVDITDLPHIQVGEEAELWGENLPVERIARASGTIAYELLCQVTARPRMSDFASDK